MFKKIKDRYQEYLNYENDDLENESQSNLEASLRRDVHIHSEESELRNNQESFSNDEIYSDRISRQSYREEQQSNHIEKDSLPQRAKYNARINNFLNNGIIIVGVLFILVLVVAFLV